jgi:hypothetical protein
MESVPFRESTPYKPEPSRRILFINLAYPTGEALRMNLPNASIPKQNLFATKDAKKPAPNSSLWVALVLALAANLCNVAFFLNPPMQGVLPWLSLVLGIAALVFVALGAKKLFAWPRSTGARIGGTVVLVLSLVLAGGSLFVSYHARALPASAGAPHVGQKAPDFTLADTNGQPVSLGQLFAPPPGDPSSAAPKAVLLIFYRGYW